MEGFPYDLVVCRLVGVPLSMSVDPYDVREGPSLDDELQVRFHILEVAELILASTHLYVEGAVLNSLIDEESYQLVEVEVAVALVKIELEVGLYFYPEYDLPLFRDWLVVVRAMPVDSLDEEDIAGDRSADQVEVRRGYVMDDIVLGCLEAQLDLADYQDNQGTAPLESSFLVNTETEEDTGPFYKNQAVAYAAMLDQDNLASGVRCFEGLDLSLALPSVRLDLNFDSFAAVDSILADSLAANGYSKVAEAFVGFVLNNI